METPQGGQALVTYCLAADVRMPDLGIELHNRRSEGILGGDLNIDSESSSLVRGARRASDSSFEMCQITRVVGGLGGDLGNAGIGLNVRQLLGDSTNPVASYSCPR